MRYDKRNEVYFWIKIRNNLMYSTEMKLLMRQHDGGWYFSIYIYLVMLSINSGGKLIQKVNNMVFVYDLTTITQELMFFKIDTIRFAIEMLKELKLLYTDEEGVLYIANFDSLVGRETGWAEHKKKQRENKLLKSVDNVPTNVHADVHLNVPPEIRDKSIEYRVKNKDSSDFYDFYDGYENYDRVTLPSDSEIIDKFKTIEEDEWIKAFSDAHIFTKYLIHSKYIERGDTENLLAADAFFENYMRLNYNFEEMKNHVQFFLLKFRKMSKEDKTNIKNRLGYLTNAIKSNQKRKEWLHSEEFEQMKKVHEIVEQELKEEALKLFPDDEVRQTMFVDEYYLPEVGAEMRRLKKEFEKKTSVS